MVARWLAVLVVSTATLAACSGELGDWSGINPAPMAFGQTPAVSPTPLPSRTSFDPGQLVDYVAQAGDTLPGLAAHFNSTVDEILEANPIIPRDVTTLPSGLPMKIPIYYLPLWGSPYKILPDDLFVNGPTQIGQDISAVVSEHSGWFRNYREYAGGANRSGAEIVNYVASNFSLSPRLLLALLEYQAGALTQPEPPAGAYLLGHVSYLHRGLYLQLVWAANTLNNGYYGWRTGRLTTFEHSDGRLERPDPWQNAASVGIQYYFSRHTSRPGYEYAISPEGLALTYQDLFGDPWRAVQAHIPGSLQQPAFLFPFSAGKAWTYTGGPHAGWGEGDPLAGIDFGPPAVVGGCASTEEWVTAVADGLVVRSETGIVVLDLDGDGDERTGWVIFYLHVATEGRTPLGAVLHVGDIIGHPSCEGGRATGTHIHIARKYNGEWIPADGPLAFNLEGWIAHNGDAPYEGTLSREGHIVTACECSDQASQIVAGE